MNPTNPNDETFAQRLTRLREAKGLSKTDLAKAADVGQSSMSRFEHRDPAQRRLPQAGTLEKLAEGLSCTVAALITDDVRRAHAGGGRTACRANHEGWKPSYVADTAVVLGKPKVGEGTTISHFVVLDAGIDAIDIGEGCEIGNGVTMLTKVTLLDGEDLTGAVKCGNNVVIGPLAILLPGTDLPDRAVVPPGSVVGPESVRRRLAPLQRGSPWR